MFGLSSSSVRVLLARSVYESSSLQEILGPSITVGDAIFFELFMEVFDVPVTVEVPIEF